MPNSPDGLRDLAVAVRERMTELRLSQPAVAAAGGPSGVTVRKILAAEKGDPPEGVKPATLAALDAALRWVPGTAADVIRGGQPRPLPEGAALPAGVGVVAGEEGAAIVLRISRSATSGKSPAELEEALHAAAAEYYRVLREQGR